MGRAIVEINDKPIRLTDIEALRLIKLRALKEKRSAANAAALTIIESLGRIIGEEPTENAGNRQG